MTTTSTIQTFPGDSTAGRQKTRRGVQLSAMAATVVTTIALCFGLMTPSASAASAYENVQFHCSTGEVTVDNLQIPYAEAPVSWRSYVFVWNASTRQWQYYKPMVTSSGSYWETAQSATDIVYHQQPMYASVPHGYYYAVETYVLPNATAGYSAHYDWATISLGYPGAGTAEYCAA